MKYRITLILFAIITCSCSNRDKEFTISLNVSNYSKDHLIFSKDTQGHGFSYFADTIWVDTKGNYKITTEPLKSKAYIVFKDSTNFRLTIPKYQNSNVNIELDLLNPDAIKIAGKQAQFVRYFYDQQQYWEKIYYTMVDKHKVFAEGNKRSPEYHTIQDTITELRMQFLVNYFKHTRNNNKKEFVDEEYNSLLYSSLYYRMSGQKNNIINSLAFCSQIEDSANNFITYSDKVNFSDKDLLSISSFRSFVNDFIMKAVRVENPDGNFSSFEFYLHNGLKLIDYWFEELQINTLYKIVFINYLVETAKIFKGKLNIYEYQKEIENLRIHKFAEPYCNLLNLRLQEVGNQMAKLSPGATPPAFELQDENGEIYKISDFQNKFLIIDIWASWCSNCISSFTKWNSIIDKYSTKDNIHFVSVCADDNQDTWLKTLQKYKPKGQNLFVGANGFESQFMKSFEIVAIPQYIILDKESKIKSIVTSINSIEKTLQNIE